MTERLSMDSFRSHSRPRRSDLSGRSLDRGSARRRVSWKAAARPGADRTGSGWKARPTRIDGPDRSVGLSRALGESGCRRTITGPDRAYPEWSRRGGEFGRLDDSPAAAGSGVASPCSRHVPLLAADRASGMGGDGNRIRRWNLLFRPCRGLRLVLRGSDGLDAERRSGFDGDGGARDVGIRRESLDLCRLLFLSDGATEAQSLEERRLRGGVAASRARLRLRGAAQPPRTIAMRIREIVRMAIPPGSKSKSVSATPLRPRSCWRCCPAPLAPDRGLGCAWRAWGFPRRPANRSPFACPIAHIRQSRRRREERPHAWRRSVAVAAALPGAVTAEEVPRCSSGVSRTRCGRRSTQGPYRGPGGAGLGSTRIDAGVGERNRRASVDVDGLFGSGGGCRV